MVVEVGVETYFLCQSIGIDETNTLQLCSRRFDSEKIRRTFVIAEQVIAIPKFFFKNHNQNKIQKKKRKTISEQKPLHQHQTTEDRSQPEVAAMLRPPDLNYRTQCN